MVNKLASRFGVVYGIQEKRTPPGSGVGSAGRFTVRLTLVTAARGRAVSASGLRLEKFGPTATGAPWRPVAPTVRPSRSYRYFSRLEGGERVGRVGGLGPRRDIHPRQPGPRHVGPDQGDAASNANDIRPPPAGLNRIASISGGASTVRQFGFDACKRRRQNPSVRQPSRSVAPE